MDSPKNLTKKELREALGFTMDKELADFYGLGKAAISAWDEHTPVPAGRQWQARAKHPDRIPEPAPPAPADQKAA